MRWILGLFLALAALVALAVRVTRPDAPTRDRLSLAAALAADTTGYARARAPRPFRFPDDHGPHPAFRTEWWYVTGNLDGPAGQRYGFELTVFRIALTPDDATARDTAGWATRQLYMAHFGLTDATTGQFHAFERFSRGAAGLAGSRAEPFRVWIDDWEMAAEPGGMSGARPAFRLRAAEGTHGVDLTFRAEKPVVLQGDRGLSQKGPGAGNASYYYSLPRLRAAGRVTTPAGTAPVTGTAWLDREWSTSALAKTQVGWDWFALHLADGRDLMVYNLREQDGRASPYSSGTLVGVDGTKTALAPDAFRLTPLATWTSPHSGAVYPARWRVEVPSEGLDLTVTPVVNDQELNVSVRYWEGAVDVADAAGRPAGRGYVELTGYDRRRAERGTRR